MGVILKKMKGKALNLLAIHAFPLVFDNEFDNEFGGRGSIFTAKPYVFGI